MANVISPAARRVSKEGVDRIEAVEEVLSSYGRR
jgi:hypothetical protein